MQIIEGPIPISLEFNLDSTYGWIDTGKMSDISNLHEYFIAPAAEYNKETKQWTVVGYSLVHVSNLPNAERFREMTKGITG